MAHLIEVSFKGNRKDFFLWEGDEVPPLTAGVIVDADRGEDLGFVYASGELAEKRNAGTPHGYGAAGTTKKATMKATNTPHGTAMLGLRKAKLNTETKPMNSNAVAM